MAALNQLTALLHLETLTKSGVPEKQAKAQLEVIAKVIDSHLVTKLDIEKLRAENKRDIALIQRDMKELENNLKRDIKELETTLKQNIKEIESKIEPIKSEVELKIQNAINKQTVILGGLFLTIAGGAITLIYQFMFLPALSQLN